MILRALYWLVVYPCGQSNLHLDVYGERERERGGGERERERETRI